MFRLQLHPPSHQLSRHMPQGAKTLQPQVLHVPILCSWQKLMPRTGLDYRPSGFTFPSQATVRAIYEYWHYGMGAASHDRFPLKGLQSRWLTSEQKLRSQAKALIAFFDSVIPDDGNVSTYASRKAIFKEQFDLFINAMSKCDLKLLHPAAMMYTSFYENYFLPFLKHLTTSPSQTNSESSSSQKSKSTRGKKRDISALVYDIQKLY